MPGIGGSVGKKHNMCDGNVMAAGSLAVTWFLEKNMEGQLVCSALTSLGGRWHRVWFCHDSAADRFYGAEGWLQR